MVARQVLVEGRSRAQLQGRMATVAAVADVVRPLVEVHGQHEFQDLLRPGVQRDLLDRSPARAVLGLRATFAAGWRRLRTVTRELDDLATRPGSVSARSTCSTTSWRRSTPPRSGWGSRPS